MLSEFCQCRRLPLFFGVFHLVIHDSNSSRRQESYMDTASCSCFSPQESNDFENGYDVKILQGTALSLKTDYYVVMMMMNIMVVCGVSCAKILHLCVRGWCYCIA